MTRLSVLIPFYNESESLPVLFARLQEVAVSMPHFVLEMVLVDDGSTDDSLKVVNRWGRQLPPRFQLKVVALARNSGKTTALTVGLAQCTGKYWVMMDADLQDDPRYLKRMLLPLMDDRADLVVGDRLDRYRGNPTKWLASRAINWLVRRSTGYNLHDINCGFKAMTAAAGRSLVLKSDYHRFIPLILAMNGFRVTEVSITQEARQFGVSKYGPTGLFRFLRSVLDITGLLFMHRFQESPFNLFGRVGFWLLFLSLGVLIYLGIGWLAGTPIHGRPLFFLATTGVIVGLNTVILGLLGELVVLGRPPRNQPHIKQLTHYR